MKGGARAHVRPGKCFFLKVEARVCGGVDTPKLKKKWAPKKVGEWEWGPKTGPFSHCNLCCVAAFAVAGGPYSLTGVGLVVRSRRVG